MRVSLRAVLMAGLVLLLAACAGQAIRSAPPLSPQEQAARAQAYAAERAHLRGAWGLSGRIAVSANGRGGSGRIDWTQAGDRYDIALGAPVTRQSWRLSGNATSARLEGLEGGAREGGDAGRLLREATGWTIPVDCLSDWVLGFSCRRWTSPVQGIEWREDGLPASIEQMGWVIEFQDWHEAANGRPALPKRIFARSTTDKATVRLVIDGWEFDAPLAAPTAPVSWTNAPLRMALSTLNLALPEADMRQRVAEGDLQVVGVCGYSCEAPGLDPRRPGLARGMRLIEGTGDVHFGIDDSLMQAEAVRYATRYNRALEKWLAMSEDERRQAPPPSARDGLPAGF